MISTVAITSLHSGNEYNLYIYEGEAKGCTCKFRQHNHNKPCRHMNEYNERYILGEDLQPHLEDVPLRSYEGCDYCGRNHKSWNCPF